MVSAQQRAEMLDNAKLIDLAEAINVEVTVDAQKKLWINVDGKCLLRIGQCDSFTYDIKAGDWVLTPRGK